MTIPKTNDILLPLLKEISDGIEHKISEIIKNLADNFDLTEEERNIRFPSHEKDKIFDNRIYFARLNLKNAGLLESPKRGLIKITQPGIDFLNTNPTKLDVKDLETFDAYREYKERISYQVKTEIKEGEEDISDESPEEIIEAAYEKINLVLITEILDLIKNNSADFFEQLVIDLLLKMGYAGSRKDAGEKIGKSHDEGIDGIIKEDKLGLDIIYIQAKRWENTVGRPELQKFAGALMEKKANKGIFITTSNYSREARDYVKNIEKNIVLIDGTQLAQYMIDYDLGVSTRIIYKINKIDSDYFEED